MFFRLKCKKTQLAHILAFESEREEYVRFYCCLWVHNIVLRRAQHCAYYTWLGNKSHCATCYWSSVKTKSIAFLFLSFFQRIKILIRDVRNNKHSLLTTASILSVIWGKTCQKSFKKKLYVNKAWRVVWNKFRGICK